MNKTADKFKLILVGVLTLFVFIGLIMNIMPNIRRGLVAESIFMAIFALIVLVFGVYFLFKNFKSVKEGFPIKDERINKITTEAAAKSFYISLYWLLAISVFGDTIFRRMGKEELKTEDAISLGIFGMAIIFGLAFLWAKGKKDL